MEKRRVCQDAWLHVTGGSFYWSLPQRRPLSPYLTLFSCLFFTFYPSLLLSSSICFSFSILLPPFHSSSLTFCSSTFYLTFLFPTFHQPHYQRYYACPMSVDTLLPFIDFQMQSRTNSGREKNYRFRYNCLSQGSGLSFFCPSRIASPAYTACKAYKTRHISTFYQNGLKFHLFIQKIN